MARVRRQSVKSKSTKREPLIFANPTPIQERSAAWTFQSHSSVFRSIAVSCGPGHMEMQLAWADFGRGQRLQILVPWTPIGDKFPAPPEFIVQEFNPNLPDPGSPRIGGPAKFIDAKAR
jgi:hypothetical protein